MTSTQCKLVSQNPASSFIAGRLQCFYNKWENLTTDSFILNIVKGCKIDLLQQPSQMHVSKQKQFSAKEATFIEAEISKLLAKQVIIPSHHEKGEYISTIFLTPKKDGSFRLILNLKRFNKFVRYQHFKMESLKQVIQMIKPDCFMASLDIRDAYYSVAIHESHQKYLKFHFKGQLYQFTCMPNGLACAPRLFTKLLKPVYGHLRAQGLLSVGYIDDSYLQGYSYDDCRHNVSTTSTFLSELGFCVHEEKSNFIPSQEIEFLGFLLNSKLMIVSLTPNKSRRLKQACEKLMTQTQPSIREVSEVIGILVASFPGVEMGPLFYRQLENDKISALKACRGHYDEVMTPSKTSLADLRWWADNIETTCKTISKPKPEYTLFTDASLLGWGANFQGKSAGGQWLPTEAVQHINYLEMSAVLLGLQTFCSSLSNTHICLKTDNTTAVSYINNMGGSQSFQCNAKAREIWIWCIQNSIWLTAVHLPGKFNGEADKASRVFHDQTEWQLNPSMYQYIVQFFAFQPDIDLFASRLNYQIQPYISWNPDPGAFAIDAFTFDWTNRRFYAFPPFSLLGRVLQKIEQDQATGILIVPDWNTQPWYPILRKMLLQEPLLLPYQKDILILPYKPGVQHPLSQRLRLMACSLSGNQSKIQESHQRPLKY